MTSRTPRRVRAVLGLAVATAVTTVPSRALAQIVFGANLNRPVNYAFDCGVGPGIGAFGERILYPTNVTSCTWLALGTNFAQQEGLLVPSGVGTITRVRIKVGRVTGPMQVVILRAIRGLPPPGGGGGVGGVVCCIEVARSAVFTPAPNAINTIATNLPVKADVLPNPITDAVEFDAVALSVLAAGVPVPAHDTGRYDDIAGPSALIFYPAVRPNEERFTGPWGAGGYQLLMEATWVPVQTGGGGGGGVVTLVQPVASQQGNLLLLGLRCNQANPCIGVLRVQNRGIGVGNVAALAATRTANTAAALPLARRARSVTFAKVRFNIPGNQTLQVGAKLTRKGKRMLRRSERPALYANLLVGGERSSAGAITIGP